MSLGTEGLSEGKKNSGHLRGRAYDTRILHGDFINHLFQDKLMGSTKRRAGVRPNSFGLRVNVTVSQGWEPPEESNP